MNDEQAGVHRSSFIIHRSSFIVHRSSFIVIAHPLARVPGFIVHRSSFQERLIHRPMHRRPKAAPIAPAAVYLGIVDLA